jgi:hypothetical protein
VTRNVSVDTGPSRYTQNISIAARSLVIGGQLRSNCEAEWKPQSGDSEQIGGLTPLGATRLKKKKAKFDESKLKALPPGSFYTEPPGRNHFAETGDEPVVVQITGFGPSSTEYPDPAQDPRARKPN